MNHICQNCGKLIKTMTYIGEQYCSENCKKALEDRAREKEINDAITISTKGIISVNTALSRLHPGGIT